MRSINLTPIQARRFLLEHQGLRGKKVFEGKPGILEYIRRVGCIQFDPLNVAGRNPELVLQARIEGYQPAMLQELLYEDRQLLDGMDKVMSIYLTEAWPYFRRFRESSQRQLGSIDVIDQALAEVREFITDKGPVASGDLSLNQTVDWSWAPTRLSRAVLESMYFWGELLVHHKKNNQKVYDYTHRHLPPELWQAEEPNPDEEAYLDWRVLRRICAIGFMWERAGDAWIGIPGLKSAERKRSILRLWECGELVRLNVEGISEGLYARTTDVDRLMNGDLEASVPERAAFIAPLDNLLWDRRLILQLFGFTYTWEVYKPAAIRDYGYYVLPILYGDSFIARFEPVRDKKDGSVRILNWWWEPGVQPTDEMMGELKHCMNSYMRFLGVQSIRIEHELAEREGIGSLIC